MNESLEKAAEELLECLQRFIYVLKGRETMDEKQERNVLDILQEIKDRAGKNPNSKIQELADEAAHVIDVHINGRRVCRRNPSPLE